MGSLSYIDPYFDSVQVDVRRAEREPTYKRIKRLMPGNVLCTRPHRRLSKDLRKTDSGMLIPEQYDKLSNEWLIACTVLKTGPGVDPDIVPGVTVMAPQFSGSIVVDDTENRFTSLWMLSQSEIIAVLESTRAQKTD